MAVTPVADASSPAVVKVNSTAATVATASFTPPSNSVIVVGFTSDADDTTGTTPTIANSGTALTWTRVVSLGHGGTGDVGLVALFTAKVVTSAAMTVTVTHNVPSAVIKPRMLVARVYPSSLVDVDDPIGAVASGPFATGTALTSGTMTPETNGGGLRMLWLDWNATGQPTTFQTNTEIVDAYHNAGLSTNVQVGKSSATAAGVSETIGATLLASATDGNWIAYEIRSSTPVTGPAFNASAFDAGAFYTTDASIHTGTATGSLAFVGTAVGARTPKASTTGTLAFAGSATGKRTPKASAVGGLTFVGTATGDAPPNRGTAGGALAFAGSATGKRTPTATTSGTVAFAGSATGRTVKRGTAGGTLAFTGTTTGKRAPKGSSNGTLTFVGTTSGKRTPKATGSGLLTFTGGAVGNTPGVGISEGSASGSLTFTGTTVGKRTPKAVTSGSLTFMGAATGRRQPKAAGAGTLTLAGAAVGAREPVAMAWGSLAWIGTATGASVGQITYALVTRAAPTSHTTTNAPTHGAISNAPAQPAATDAPTSHTTRSAP